MARLRFPMIAFPMLFVLSACGGSHTGAPTGPGAAGSGSRASDPSAGPPPPPTQASASPGTIRLIDLKPGPGASLAVQPCFNSGQRRECAVWSGTFEVTVPGSVEWPVLTVSFYDGVKRCGYGAATLPSNSLEAGVTERFKPTMVFLTDEFGTFSPPCSLPASATRMVAELWTDTNWNFSVKQEFPVSYTFVKP